jgi:hypothetical protein
MQPSFAFLFAGSACAYMHACIHTLPCTSGLSFQPFKSPGRGRLNHIQCQVPQLSPLAPKPATNQLPQGRATTRSCINSRLDVSTLQSPRPVKSTPAPPHAMPSLPFARALFHMVTARRLRRCTNHMQRLLTGPTRVHNSIACHAPARVGACCRRSSLILHVLLLLGYLGVRSCKQTRACLPNQPQTAEALVMLVTLSITSPLYIMGWRGAANGRLNYTWVDDHATALLIPQLVGNFLA